MSHLPVFFDLYLIDTVGKDLVIPFYLSAGNKFFSVICKSFYVFRCVCITCEPLLPSYAKELCSFPRSCKLIPDFIISSVFNSLVRLWVL